MTIRSTMHNLIARVRELITDVGTPGDAFYTQATTLTAPSDTTRYDAIGTTTLTLPPLSAAMPLLIIRKLDSDNTLTVTAAGSDTINDAATTSITLTRRYNTTHLRYQGTNRWSAVVNASKASMMPDADLAFSDEQVQEALDRNSQVLTRHSLECLNADIEPDTVPTGFYAYRARCAPWESPTLYDASEHTAVTPDESDNTAGIWRFNARQDNPLYVAGRCFDPMATAAHLLGRWIALIKLEYTYSDGSQRLERQQRVKTLEDLRIAYYGERSLSATRDGV